MPKPKATPRATKMRAPPTPPLPRDVAEDLKGFEISPLKWLLRVVNDDTAEPARRDRCAIAACQYLHGRVREGGVKAARAAEAEEVAEIGPFARRK